MCLFDILSKLMDTAVKDCQRNARRVERDGEKKVFEKQQRARKIESLLNIYGGF